MNREAAREFREQCRAERQRVGFTSGVFDLVHPGHVRYLAAARALCDRLIVAVNSDVSVRLLKGERRPIMPEDARLAVVQALASVDCAFLFDERSNQRNIEVLKPDMYIKAGDYEKSRLSSAPLVESYGGEVLCVPFEAGFSTSSIIDLVLRRYHDCIPLCDELPPLPPLPAIFVDRDGTVNEHIPYLHEPEKFAPIPGALEALRDLREAGFRIVVVTNQPGIGLGYFSKEDFFRVNEAMLRAASRVGLTIDGVYYCPHTKGAGSSWRKPEPGMLHAAAKNLNIELDKSFMIGDMTTDIESGRRAGCRTILVQTGRAGADGIQDGVADFVVPSLAEAREVILAAVAGQKTKG